MPLNDAASQGPRPIDVALLASVFVIAACGLLYELAAGALASYLLGDSVVGPAKLQPPHPHWLSAGFDLYPSLR